MRAWVCKDCEFFKNNFNLSSESAVYPPCFSRQSLLCFRQRQNSRWDREVHGSGAAGFGRGDLGPRHSHSLGLKISSYAFDPKNSSRLKILGPLSTFNSKLCSKTGGRLSVRMLFPGWTWCWPWPRQPLGLSPCHQGAMPQALITGE